MTESRSQVYLRRSLSELIVRMIKFSKKKMQIEIGNGADVSSDDQAKQTMNHKTNIYFFTNIIKFVQVQVS